MPQTNWVNFHKGILAGDVSLWGKFFRCVLIFNRFQCLNAGKVNAHSEGELKFMKALHTGYVDMYDIILSRGMRTTSKGPGYNMIV